MLNEETKRIVALGICILFLGIPMLGYLSGGEESEPTLAEQSENSSTQSSGPP